MKLSFTEELHARNVSFVQIGLKVIGMWEFERRVGRFVEMLRMVDILWLVLGIGNCCQMNPAVVPQQGQEV